jgi:anti-anti-sigma factor
MAVTGISSSASVACALTTAVRSEGTRTVVALRGEADFTTTLVLADVLAGVIDLGVGDVVIDLGNLEFIDTATVRVLAAGQWRLDRLGRALTFRSPARVAARVLKMFGLDDLIETHEKSRP